MEKKNIYERHMNDILVHVADPNLLKGIVVVVYDLLLPMRL